MKKKLETTEVKLQELSLSMTELGELRIMCEAVAASAACTFKIDMKIKRVGQRAITLLNDTIDIESAEIKNRMDKFMKDLGKTTFKPAEHPAYLKLVEEEQELFDKKATFSFEPVFVETDDDDEDFSQRFPKEIKVQFKNREYTKNPYKCFQDLIEKGIITI